MRKPLVVRRHHIPRRLRRRRLANHILIRLLVLVPRIPLLQVRCRKLPVLRRVIQPRQKTPLLLRFRHMQKKLPHDHPVVRQVPLIRPHILETVLPNLLRHQRLRQPLRRQNLLVHPHHQHLLIVTAIENADLPPLRQRHVRAPQKVVVQFQRRRRLERMHVATLRIDPRHHMLDRPVLARRIHRLEN